MKLLVGYNGGEEGRLNLSLAKEHALLTQSFVYIVTSMAGGPSEKQSDIARADQGLLFAKQLMERSGIPCETQLSVRNLSPGEDLVRFAREKGIDHIFLGIKKKSKAQKIIMGSTSQYVILNATCPVHIVRFDIDTIKTEDLIKNRRVLVVDDEPDVLVSVQELLEMCVIDTASDFDTAEKYLEERSYDIAILDIMGVRGFEVLQIARKKDIPCLMLTAHALNPENLKESIQKGADSYIPKEEMVNIDSHIADVLKARIQGRQGYGEWFRRLKTLFDKTFGKNWREKDRDFWRVFDDRYNK
jgi:nucleotide-binding universal stress UspA family protein/CheY-like chemotaxis protein